jgi:SAM-dependent methyltransferase
MPAQSPFQNHQAEGYLSQAMNPKIRESLDPAYFARLYEANADPWQFETSAYERGKYCSSLMALPLEHYHCGFEIGGSIGVLTSMLADRCDRLLSVDVSPVAQQRARNRCADRPNVEFRVMRFPRQTPLETFDLIVFSEVGYYFCLPELAIARSWIAEALQPGGHLLLVHWTPSVEDCPLTGDEVHEHFLEMTPTPLNRIFHQESVNYRIDVLARPSLLP